MIALKMAGFVNKDVMKQTNKCLQKTRFQCTEKLSGGPINITQSNSRKVAFSSYQESHPDC